MGLMSGTSGDGVDASVISSDGISDYNEVINKYFKYDQKMYENLHNLRSKILKFDDLKKNENEINILEREITLFHAKIVNEIFQLTDRKIDFLGFHGQTIYHNALEKISKQIGDGKLLSQLTKKTVIYNFRQNDIENGGNARSVEETNFYLGNNNEVRHIRLQINQSVYAHERLAVYIKEAIGGDLTYDNTDDIITGDWDTVGNNVSTYFDGVKTEVDNLITTINDMIAPTNNDFAIGGDRLYFNRQYIAEEATGLTTDEFNYTLNTIQYQAFSYPGTGNTEVVRQNNLVDIIQGMISDLQTGGTNSTIQAMETFIDANKQIIDVEEELGAFIFSIEQIGVIGEFALNNRLYDFNSGFTLPDYAALKTDETAYRDTESPTNIATVITRFKELVEANYEISFDDVLSNISHRDKQDINRKNSPLKKASDSIVIFTDNFTLVQLEEKLLSYVTPLISKK